MYYYVNSNELYHHGVLGMKWGIRRYQPYPPGKKGKEVGEAAKAEQIDQKHIKKPGLVNNKKLITSGYVAMSAAVGAIMGSSIGFLTGSPIVGGMVGVGVATSGYAKLKEITNASLEKCKNYKVNQFNSAMNNAQRQAMLEESQRAMFFASQESRRAASLAVTGGMDPFRFG